MPNWRYLLALLIFAPQVFRMTYESLQPRLDKFYTKRDKFFLENNFLSSRGIDFGLDLPRRTKVDLKKHFLPEQDILKYLANEEQSSPDRQILLIVGPDWNGAYQGKTPRFANELANRVGDNLYIVGDGYVDINTEHILTVARSMPQKPTTVIIAAHGTNIHGQHTFCSGSGQYKGEITTIDLIEQINSYLTKTDYFITSCHGGQVVLDQAARVKAKAKHNKFLQSIDISERDFLSVTVGETIITLAPASRVTYVNIYTLVDAIRARPDLEINAMNLLRLYLAQSISSHHRIHVLDEQAPQIYAEGALIDSANILAMQGKLNDSERKEIQSELKGLIPADIIDRVIAMINRGQIDSQSYASLAHAFLLATALKHKQMSITLEHDTPYQSNQNAITLSQDDTVNFLLESLTKAIKSQKPDIVRKILHSSHINPLLDVMRSAYGMDNYIRDLVKVIVNADDLDSFKIIMKRLFENKHAAGDFALAIFLQVINSSKGGKLFRHLLSNFAKIPGVEYLRIIDLLDAALIMRNSEVVELVLNSDHLRREVNFASMEVLKYSIAHDYFDVINLVPEFEQFWSKHIQDIILEFLRYGKSVDRFLNDADVIAQLQKYPNKANYILSGLLIPMNFQTPPEKLVSTIRRISKICSPTFDVIERGIYNGQLMALEALLEGMPQLTPEEIEQVLAIGYTLISNDPEKTIEPAAKFLKLCEYFLTQRVDTQDMYQQKALIATYRKILKETTFYDEELEARKKRLLIALESPQFRTST